jgi:hypothetical protein
MLGHFYIIIFQDLLQQYFLTLFLTAKVVSVKNKVKKYC